MSHRQFKHYLQKPADKNLGLVLVDTDWYVDELRKMLCMRAGRGMNCQRSRVVRRSVMRMIGVCAMLQCERVLLADFLLLR